MAVFVLVLLPGCQHFVKSHIGRELTTADFQALTAHEDETWLPVKRQIAHKIEIPAAYKAPISLHISQDMPLNAAIEQACRLLNIDVQIDKKVQDSKIFISFSATNKPFIDVLESICALAKLRYRLSNGMLFIEPDVPYNKNYNVQFLNLTRLSENRISSGTDIFAHSVGNADGNGINGENGSNTSVSMNSENNFWKELEANLQTILSINTDAGSSPRFTIHRQAGIISVCGTSEQHHCVKEYIEALRCSVGSQVLIEAKIIEVLLHDEFKSGINWGILQAGEGETLKNGGYGGFSFENQDITNGSTFNLATSATKSAAEGAAGGATADETTAAKALESAGKVLAPSGFMQFTKTFSNGIAGIIKALQHFGETRTLSSPRLTVMNNQSAILKVAENHVYFKLNYNKHYYNKTEREDISVGSDIKTVPIGLVMSVQPAIDPENQSVILFLRPTVSSLVKTVADPSIAIAINSTTKDLPKSEIPVVQVKEIDSVLRLKDGEVAILGGLMEVSSSHDRFKHPIFGEVPIVKEAFSNLNKSEQVKEIVILIRVRILDSAPPDKADLRLVHLYTTDPRPIC
ncbi:MAG: secretin N-terminal domain-containing protein [Holosporales bacterium]|nr:secretin N-terminal domain-containing protein [Holosporales bacterium]